MVFAGGTLDLLAPPAIDGRDVCEAGLAGGPIDVRLPPMLGRGLDIVMEGFLVLVLGVPVRGVEALEVAADSCFVGDLVGDYTVVSIYSTKNMTKLTRRMLDGLDLVAGLGLAAFMLCLFPDAASDTVLTLLPAAAPPTLLGLVGFFMTAAPFCFGGAACSITAPAGRTNIPRPASQSK